MYHKKIPPENQDLAPQFDSVRLYRTHGTWSSGSLPQSGVMRRVEGRPDSALLAFKAVLGVVDSGDELALAAAAGRTRRSLE